MPFSAELRNKNKKYFYRSTRGGRIRFAKIMSRMMQSLNFIIAPWITPFVSITNGVSVPSDNVADADGVPFMRLSLLSDVRAVFHATQCESMPMWSFVSFHTDGALPLSLQRHTFWRYVPRERLSCRFASERLSRRERICVDWRRVRYWARTCAHSQTLSRTRFLSISKNTTFFVIQ